MRARLGLPLALLVIAGPALAQGRASGEVADESGTPVAALTLRLLEEDGDPAPIAPIEVKKGRFTIPRFPPGSHRLEVAEGDSVIRKFAVSVRGSDGSRLGEMETDVPPGSRAPLFQVSGSQRADLRLVVGPSAVAGLGSAAEIRAAKATSATLERLNELFTKGDYATLLAETETALAEDPDLGGALYLRGVALWKTGRPEEAAPPLRRVLEVEPDQPGIRGVFGAVLLEVAAERDNAGRKDEARAAASEAADLYATEIAERPSDVSALTNRVIALERAGRAAESIPVLEALAAADPANPRPLYRLAEVLMEGGRNADALQALDRIEPKTTDTAIAAYNVGVSAFNKGDMAGAAAAARKAIAVAPEVAHPHQLLGKCLLSEGDTEGAVRELKEFVRLAPNDPDAAAERELIKAIE